MIVPPVGAPAINKVDAVVPVPDVVGWAKYVKYVFVPSVVEAGLTYNVADAAVVEPTLVNAVRPVILTAPDPIIMAPVGVENVPDDPLKLILPLVAVILTAPVVTVNPFDAVNVAPKIDAAPKYAPPAHCNAPVIGLVDVVVLASVRTELAPDKDKFPDPIVCVPVESPNNMFVLVPAS